MFLTTLIIKAKKGKLTKGSSIVGRINCGTVIQWNTYSVTATHNTMIWMNLANKNKKSDILCGTIYMKFKGRQNQSMTLESE